MRPTWIDTETSTSKRDRSQINAVIADAQEREAALPFGVDLGLSNTVGRSGRAHVAEIEGSVALWIAWRSDIA